LVTTDLNTLLTALDVKIDDWLGRPRRHGRPPRLSDAELLTLTVAQALLGIRFEARWLRFIPGHLPGAFPYLPGQSVATDIGPHVPVWRHRPTPPIDRTLARRAACYKGHKVSGGVPSGILSSACPDVSRLRRSPARHGELLERA